MPTYDVSKILHPRPKQDDIYDQMKDLIQIFTGGLGVAPSSQGIQDAIDKEWSLYNATSDPNKKRETEKRINALEKQRETIEGKETKLDSVGIKEFMDKKLSDAESMFANDPYSYIEATRQLYRVAFTQMDELLTGIPEENYSNYTDIANYQDLLEGYKDNAKELGVVSTAMKGGDSKLLKYYGVYYNSNPSGVLSMSIGPTSKKPSGAKPTNVKTSEGLPVYLIDNQPLEESLMKKVVLGDKEFRYMGVTGSFRIPNPETFDWESVKKRNVAAASWGDFLQDGKGSKYFVTKDQQFAPVSDDMFTELGGNEWNLQKMTSWEEKNDLPNLRTSPVQPAKPMLKESMEPPTWFSEPAQAAYRKKSSARMSSFLGLGSPKKSKYVPPTEAESVGGRTQSIFKSKY